MFTLAVDVMGGDLGPHVALRACRKLLKRRPDVNLIIAILASEAEMAAKLLGHPQRVRILPCETQISMLDKPAQMLRCGQSSTMAQAVLEVQEGRAQAIISAGNTGALMVLSKHLLSTLNGIARPALATILPSRHKPLLMLDLGANLNVSPEQLVQFAALGYSWSKLLMTPNPQVGLLNVGKEASKGTERLRETDELLKVALPEAYQGFCEGNDIYDGEFDVIVTDGFVGNVMLKASESLSYWLLEQINAEFRHHWLRRWFVPLWYRSFKAIERRMAPARYAGALLLGINGVVVKTHGSSDERTFYNALNYVLAQLVNYQGATMQSCLDEVLSRLSPPAPLQ